MTDRAIITIEHQ